MNSKLIFVTSYLPRECGIATFTNDLINAIKNQMDDSIEIEVCALENGHQGFDYLKEVKYVLDATKIEQYQQIAEKINEDHQVKTVMTEHEFGLFGGEWGDYMLNMVDVLEKFVFTTFHTVLPHSNDKILKISKAFTDKSKKILVMTNSSRQILIDEYKLPEDKSKIVPYSIHTILWKHKEKVKEKFGISHMPILSNFGLLVGHKSIETAIIAKATFDFLLSKIFMDGRIKVIPNNGWFHKKKKRQEGYGEQPVDVAYSIMALDLFYSELGEPRGLTKLNIAFDWFMGLNHLNQIIYNPATRGCYDGLEKDGVNLNQGEESAISYLIAWFIMVKYYHVQKRKISNPIYHTEQLKNLLKNRKEKDKSL
ncbi:MAG: hypothetical protein H8D45_11805 [Bacteroidetes bacterium]|nr:hypothetical protein [Bacteroidota bacterium]MBL7103514.1 hypothetical protein [Bacteroidales bacterium]